MKRGIYILPNSITLCGMFAGFFAIISAIKGEFYISAWAILTAGLFDALDGWVARLTNTTSKFGIELDSLSDAIAFGVAPAVLVYNWTLASFGRPHHFRILSQDPDFTANSRQACGRSS